LVGPDWWSGVAAGAVAAGELVSPARDNAGVPTMAAAKMATVVIFCIVLFIV
jgi:hypothetical protein